MNYNSYQKLGKAVHQLRQEGLSLAELVRELEPYHKREDIFVAAHNYYTPLAVARACKQMDLPPAEATWHLISKQCMGVGIAVASGAVQQAYGLTDAEAARNIQKTFAHKP
jgi:hypothetical protein